jgi:hypothetical protein
VIFLDEAIHGPTIVRPIAIWYTGQVVSLNSLRLGTLVKDEAVPMLLRTVSRPTFVTLNVDDFWHKIPPDPHYSIICFELTAKEVLKLPDILRTIFQMPEFKTKAARMGKIVRVYATRIDFYGGNRELNSLNLRK